MVLRKSVCRPPLTFCVNSSPATVRSAKIDRDSARMTYRLCGYAVRSTGFGERCPKACWARRTSDDNYSGRAFRRRNVIFNILTTRAVFVSVLRPFWFCVRTSTPTTGFVCAKNPRNTHLKML